MFLISTKSVELRARKIIWNTSACFLVVIALGITTNLYAADTQSLKKQIYETKLHYAQTLHKLRTLHEKQKVFKGKSKKRIFRVDNQNFILSPVDSTVLKELQTMRSQLMAAAHQYGESLGKLSVLKSNLTHSNLLTEPLSIRNRLNITPLSESISTQNQATSQYNQIRAEFAKLQNHYKSTLGQLQDMEKQINHNIEIEDSTEVGSLDIKNHINSGLRRTSAGSAQIAKNRRKDTTQVANIQQSGVTIHKSSRNKNNFTFEFGSEYKRYDRSQVTLNGFLALDAIFLGDIAVENVASDTFTIPLNLSYRMTPNLVLFSQAPFIKRSTTYSKSGANGGSTQLTTSTIDQDFELGDFSAGWNYKFFNGEETGKPSLTWGFTVTAPTGNDPYGIPVNVISVDEEGLTQFSVPESLPTGNGVWSIKNSLTILKTADPAVLFANIGYTHHLKQHFSDLDSNPEEDTAGDLDLGNSLALGFGVAFGLNQNTSISIALNSRAAKAASTEVVVNGIRDLQTIDSSDAKAATLNLGINYAFSKKMSVASSIGIGLTDDASDLVVGLKFPYSF